MPHNYLKFIINVRVKCKSNTLYSTIIYSAHIQHTLRSLLVIGQQPTPYWRSICPQCLCVEAIAVEAIAVEQAISALFLQLRFRRFFLSQFSIIGTYRCHLPFWEGHWTSPGENLRYVTKKIVNVKSLYVHSSILNNVVVDN